MRPRLFSRFLVQGLVFLLLVCFPASGLAQGSPRLALFQSDTLSIGGGAALSPDGQWLALALLESPQTASIWVVRPHGRHPSRLTSPGKWDGNLAWSASGETLYFVSNRPAASGDSDSYYGMALPFDRRRGVASGEPRQVTPQSMLGYLRPSPDGKTVVFVDAGDRQLLKVVNARGGDPRVVTRMPAGGTNPVWSPTGEDLYFNASDESGRTLYRVSLAGGEPQIVRRGLPRGRLIFGGDPAALLVEEADAEGPRGRVLTPVKDGDRRLPAVAINRDIRVIHVTPDNRSVIAVENRIVAPTRIMSVDGGAYKEVTPARAYDWVMRWSPDGASVYVWTEIDGAQAVSVLPINGAAPTVLARDSAEWAVRGANERYVFYATRQNAAMERSIAAVDTRDGARHLITNNAPGTAFILPYGPGGAAAVQDELYFLERGGDGLQVRAWMGPDKIRTLLTLPASAVGRTHVAVHGDMVAWHESFGDSTMVMVSDSAAAVPRRLLTAPGLQRANDIAFSYDGTRIVVHYSAGPRSPDIMAVLDVAARVPPRMINTGLRYWYWPRWVPSDDAVVIIGGGIGTEANVVLIPLAEGAQPVNVTREDPSLKWGFELSPDGRYIAYPGEVRKGSAVWRIHLDPSP